MSIELIDKNGPIGQAATNSGFGEAREECLKLGGSLLKEFFENGITKQPKKVAHQALAVAHSTKDNQIRNTLVNIYKLLNNADEFAMVETG